MNHHGPRAAPAMSTETAYRTMRFAVMAMLSASLFGLGVAVGEHQGAREGYFRENPPGSMPMSVNVFARIEEPQKVALFRQALLADGYELKTEMSGEALRRSPVAGIHGRDGFMMSARKGRYLISISHGFLTGSGWLSVQASTVTLKEEQFPENGLHAEARRIYERARRLGATVPDYSSEKQPIQVSTSIRPRATPF